MTTRQNLRKATGDYFGDPRLYICVIGALQYTTTTRPNIAYTVSKLSQFTESLSNHHWQACKRILRYIRGNQELGLNFTRGDIKELIAYTNVDWVSNPDDIESVSVYCIFYPENLVSWSSKKQSVISRSST